MSSPDRFYSVYKHLPVFLQNAIVSIKSGRRWKHENSRQFQSIVEELLRIQYASSEEILEYRKNKLGAVLKAAAKTEYYRRELPEDEIIEKEPFAVLADIPVLEREEVRNNFRKFINPLYTDKMMKHGTSGTTGTPLQVMWTEESMDMERALIWRQRRVTGLSFGEAWRGMLGGHKIVPLSVTAAPFWRTNRKAKQVYFSTFHISPDAAGDYREGLDKYDIEYLEGYPSVLYALALALDSADIRYRLKGIYYGAEPLREFQRELIEKVFETYVWDYYGLTERVASASEYECRNGLHENWENCFPEVVDKKGCLLDDGQYGELAGTSFSNLGFPLLRYRTGDMTRIIPGKCTCRRDSRRIAPIDTKREDLLIMPDGSYLSASNMTYPFKEVGHIKLSQIYQGQRNLIEVRVVPDSDYREEDGIALAGKLKKLLPAEVSVKIELVDDIPKTASGKYAFCICAIKELPPEED